MTDSLPSRVADLVVGADVGQLRKIVGSLREKATDQRTARRVLEREAPGALAADLLDLLEDDGITVVISALEASIETVRLTRQRLGRTEIVWTGPETKTLAMRPTRAVVLELIERAQTSLTLVTFAGYDIVDLVKALDRARLERGVSVRVIVETSEDSPKGEGPEAAAALKHLPNAVPVYRWPKEHRGTKPGSMHVKCVIRDREEVLVTSANLTSAALDRNMELGLLVDGGASALAIEQHYDDLIETHELVQLT